MTVWFEGAHEIECSIQEVKAALENLGAHFAGVVGRMPGLSSVELVEQGPGFVTIRTNEGLMERTSIVTRFEAEHVTVTYDETYRAGRTMTTSAHFLDEFTASDHGVTHRTVIRDVEASGILGFFYRTFGRSNTGNAFLAATKAQLESRGAAA